ncbi:NUDIX hydrolase [Kitasatospora sp. NBC_01287]|uniref:NUDIX hydrolase n=1 Tax=Kitasatospora sp. NBC_01287 TaxID=2903573 RepID=UPI002B1DC7B5|nr:NUDIX hydrolase [Kitasatospora sp. NBC_01287]
MGERLSAEQQTDPRQTGPRSGEPRMAAAAAGPAGPLARRQAREAKRQGRWTGAGHAAGRDAAAAREADGSGGRMGTVLAAGAVLWLPGGPRRDGSGERKPRIALIHRPKYDDWSLPKGKLRAGETPWQAALREVEEETGLVCRLLAPLPAQHYLAQGRPKEVRYWAAVPVRGEFRPNREVDRMKWLKPGKARAKLTHDRDRELIDALLEQFGRLERLAG